MQISYCICTKVSQEGILWRKATGNRRDFANAVQLEENQDHRSRGVSGPCAHAGGDTAESGSIELYGVPEGEEQPDDLRKISGIVVQVSEQGVLVQRVLCGYSGKECKKD